MSGAMEQKTPEISDRGMRRRLFLLLFLVVCVSPTAFAQFLDETINQGKASTVRVITDLGHGSGFVISDRGDVGTNFHVIEGAKEILVVFASGDRIYVYPAKVIATEERQDLAIIKIQESIPNSRVVTLAVSETTSGQDVMSIGFPGIVDNLDFSSDSRLEQISENVFKGDKTAISLQTPATFPGNVGKGSGSHIVHSAKISGGNSGGPLIDLEARVVGINTFIPDPETTSVDYAFSVPAARLAELARKNGVKVTVSTARVSAPGSSGGLMIMLFVVVAALSVVTFMMALRRPRTILVDGLSRLTGSRSHRSKASSGAPSPAQQPPPAAGSGNRAGMTLRGRDPEGNSYCFNFDADTFRKAGGRLYLGRNKSLCQFQLPQDSVSRQHAALIAKHDAVYLEDRNSGNGTLINGREIGLGDSAARLKSGDRIQLGEVKLIFDVLS